MFVATKAKPLATTITGSLPRPHWFTANLRGQPFLAAFNGDAVYRTYFTAGRGVEALGSVWTFLDLTPYGRQEEWEDSPSGWPQTSPYTWWRRHDEY